MQFISEQFHGRKSLHVYKCTLLFFFFAGAEIYASFTVKDCFPVRVTEVTNNMVNASVTTEFFDIVEGIPYPIDFVVPQECNRAPYVPSKFTPKYLFRK